MAASNGPLQIIVPFGDDSSLLFSKLQTAYTNGEKSSSSAIISYVFSPRSPDKNNETTLLASLCYQLLCLKPQLFEHVATLNDSLQKFAKDVVWRVHRLFILFRSLLSCPHEGETICVLREMDGTKFPERLVPNLLSLATGVDSKFKLVIISGTSTTSKIPAVQLKQEEFDLEAVLDYELDSLISNRPGLLTTRSTLRKGLLTQHEKKPGLFVGMFDAVTAAVRVWLELIIKIAEPVSVSSITHSLALMPNKIEDIYKDILQRIPHHCRRKMRSVLSWLALSQRPLEVAELAAISALEDEIQTIDALRKNTQVNLSGDLQIAFGTVIQINDNRYPLLPGELRAFLLRGHPKDKKSECDGTCVFCLDGELELARTCLRFLRLYKEEDPHSLVAVQKDHPFLRYASRRWPDHYINGKSAMLQGQEQSPMSSNPSPSDVLDFSRDDDKLISFWAKMYYLLQNPDVECPAGTSLPMAAEVGCLDLVKSLLPSMDAEQEEDAAALSRGFVAAISRGDTEIIDAFIAAKVSSSLALHAAASSGQRHLLERLTTFKDALEAKGMEGLTQLHCACRSGVLGVVEDLLDAGADAKAKSSDEETTPLHIACMFGHAAVIRRLEELDDLDINAKDKFGRTPLYYACKWQQPDAVRALLQDPKGREIDVNMVDSKSETTALHHAAGEGRLDILKLILSYRYPSKDAAADKLADGPADDWEDASDDEVDDTSSKDSYTRVQNLLSKKDASDSTALHFAARDGHLEVAKELARRENSLSLAASLKEDSEGNLPIHLASKNGHASIVKLLLKNNISTQLSWMASGEEYALPIHLAVSHGHIEVVRHLAEAHEKERVVSLDLFYGRQRSALHLAATSGQIDIVRLLVEHGATPDILDFDDATPLLLACQGGHEAVADFLVKKGADVSIPNDRKLCPLIAAIQARNVNLARLLLENGAKTNVATSAGTTPLLAAAQAGNVSIMEILNSSKTDWGARDDQGLSALHWAAKSGSDEAIDFVLQHSNLIDVKDNNGRTVLHYAAQDESLSVIRRKLRGNFGLFEGDNSGETPLELAQPEGVLKELLSSTDLHDAKFEELRKKLVRRSVHRGYAETVATLWDKDAKLGEADSSEQTLLHIAAQAGHHHIVNYLVNDAKIRPDAKDAKGRTALSLAAEEGHLEVVKFLAQEAPTGTKETDSEGNTPLVYASGMGHLNVVSFLLDYANPDVNSKDLLVANNKNRGPLWAAVSGNRTEIVKLLLQQGAEVNIVERSESFTPLHLAVQHNFVDIIDLLLAADGIDGHARDDKDRTPIYIGAYYGRTDAVKKLIDAGWLGNFPESTCHWLPLHAAYDNPDILQLLIDKAKMDVNKADRDGSTALHLAAQGYPNSVRLLLQRDANPILPDNERITPLHLAAKCSDPDTVGLILDKALATKTSSEEAVNIPGLKDMMGRSAFLAATASGNTSVVHFFLKRELFDPLETDNDDITAVDLAVKSDSSSTVELLLNVVGSDFKPETQRRVLVWAAGGNSSNSVYRNIETQLIELLQDGEPMGPWEDKKLFELAMEREDIPLAKLLRYHGLGEMAAQRDKHRWTLEQIIGAFEPKSEKDEEEGQDEKPLPPSQWDTNRKADSVKTAKLETYGTVLRMRFESPYSSRLGSVLSDHPVPPTEKFYFEITVISGSEERLVFFPASACHVLCSPRRPPPLFCSPDIPKDTRTQCALLTRILQRISVCA
jgi:ankyrin repeat protein